MTLGACLEHCAAWAATTAITMATRLGLQALWIGFGLANRRRQRRRPRGPTLIPSTPAAEAPVAAEEAAATASPRGCNSQSMLQQPGHAAATAMPGGYGEEPPPTRARRGRAAIEATEATEAEHLPDLIPAPQHPAAMRPDLRSRIRDDRFWPRRGASEASA